MKGNKKQIHLLSAAHPVNMNNQVNSGCGKTSPISVDSEDEDDGRWGVESPGVGTGWMGNFAIHFRSCMFRTAQRN